MKKYSILSPSFLLVTSDVQSANITFFKTTVSLYCVFAVSGSAKACRFVLTPTNGTRENIDLLRPSAGGTISMECAYTSHKRFTSSNMYAPHITCIYMFVHNSAHTMPCIIYCVSSYVLHLPHACMHTHVYKHRNDYITIVVFDVREDNTTGNLTILPHVEESDQLPCGEQPNKSQLLLFLVVLFLPIASIAVTVIISCCYWYKQSHASTGVQTTETDLVRMFVLLPIPLTLAALHHNGDLYKHST